MNDKPEPVREFEAEQSDIIVMHSADHREANTAIDLHKDAISK